MRVIALKPGFYDGARRRVGDVFDIDESQLEHEPVSGVPILPRWLHDADDKRGAQKRIEIQKFQFARGALASAPPQGGK